MFSGSDDPADLPRDHAGADDHCRPHASLAAGGDLHGVVGGGGLAGYAIGYFLFDSIGRGIIDFYGAGNGFDALRQSFNDNGPLMILIGALSPIPYKVITITSGVAGLDIWTFVIYGLIGRSIRYFLPCGLFYFFGPVAGQFIEKNKKWATIGMIVLAIVGFAMAPLMFPKSHGPATETAVEQMNAVDEVVPNELIPGAPAEQ
ncbi:YqaA family protein [Devosia aurantiaca]|uniref:VTT domain-containing protein n=1 Tax=Devosia aurantiaca TaxID=2714858 RepID=A0A6M1SP29_9HYPH|nr:VTT domain-containing protein [Devosia aurantiaca]NGP17262.1 hypothetical protein [Devosia aurantiaca]